MKIGMAQIFGQELPTELQKHITPFTFQLMSLWNKVKFYPGTMPKSFDTALVYYSTPFAYHHSPHVPNLHTQITTNGYGL